MADFSKDKLIEILSDETKNQWLFSLADKVRQENIGDEIYLRGLIEFSNICKRRYLMCIYEISCCDTTLRRIEIWVNLLIF